MRPRHVSFVRSFPDRQIITRISIISREAFISKRRRAHTKTLAAPPENKNSSLIFFSHQISYNPHKYPSQGIFSFVRFCPYK
ncbi:hypothetical protein Ddye_008546, partial [Dipteronia dyeriana]